MLDKLKTYYQEHTMYVNIALVALVGFIAWKIFKKK